jgi:hypothetical protein
MPFNIGDRVRDVNDREGNSLNFWREPLGGVGKCSNRSLKSELPAENDSFLFDEELSDRSCRLGGITVKKTGYCRVEVTGIGYPCPWQGISEFIYLRLKSWIYGDQENFKSSVSKGRTP